MLPSSDTTVVLSVVGALVVVLEVALRVVALGVIPGNRKPSTGMAWLLLVLLSPLVGLVAFAFLGSNRVGKRRHARQREINAAMNERVDALPRAGADELRPVVRTVVELNRGLGALPLVDDVDVVLLEDYADTIAAMTEAVERAHHHVLVEFYISAWDDVTAPFFEALVAATERGVSVRLLFDHLGSRGIPGYRGFLRRLRATDIDWHPMLPIQPLRRRFRRPDLRNHRKLLVVDGLVGFTGSLNLVEPGYNKPANHRAGREWVELMCRVEGPLVTELAAVFASDWFFETDERVPVEGAGRPAPDPRSAEAVTGVKAQVVPSGPGYDEENNLRMFTTLIYAATDRISLTSPYFVPDESLLYAVTTAARRGVAVELFVSEQSDQFMVGHAQASFYEELLRSGVVIHLYPAPYVLHSKHFTVDDDVAVIGSSNMDQRSFALNYEVSAMLLGPEVVSRVRQVEDHYRALSRPLTLDEWALRPRRTRYVDNVMRLTSALQ
ncbi:cardiolipin synthetase 2 [Nocardioides scoriae]|uniref:Cardiolipin synthase n=1 Tax=Nocardioides scoriae TaxID=642780 RepID=A0A1H1LS36_9ACTN|nr:cardiolipin synthase [Nocardioides scoriae]SDR77152.1 cardiolipin synthetase 2 [Nocardioides scoriae]